MSRFALSLLHSSVEVEVQLPSRDQTRDSRVTTFKLEASHISREICKGKDMNSTSPGQSNVAKEWPAQIDTVHCCKHDVQPASYMLLPGFVHKLDQEPGASTVYSWGVNRVLRVRSGRHYQRTV